MSGKKGKKTPPQNGSQAGYGRPPVHSRFRKGQSGNPTGKRKPSAAQALNELFYQEANRLLTVREGDNVTKVPAIQAVIRSQIASAAKGSVAAQRAFLKNVQETAEPTKTASNRKTAKDLNEMTDEELMDIARRGQDSQDSGE